MSEKGVLSKSIANNISEAIIDKLGGTGYAPTEWKRNINLLGITSADIEEALASITEDASSSDKGLLSLSIASDMGAILNKKYNTSRGFKPSEVSSAVSALIPLPEKTVSSAPIATFSDGADAVPLKSWEVTLPASLDGVSSVAVVQTGANLLFNNIEDGTTGGIDYTKQSDGSIACSGTVSNVNATRLINTVVLPVGNYVLSGADSSINLRAVLYDSEGAVITNRNDTGSGVTISVDNTVSHIEVRIKARTNAEQVSTTISPMLAVGSTPQTYEKYNGEQYTAQLGRTIYGGTAEVVNGNCEPFNLVSLNRSPQQEKRDYGITVNTQNENTLNVTTTGVAYACERLFYSFKKGTYAIKYLATSSDSYTPTISIYRTNGTGVKFSIQPNTLTTFTLSEDTNIDIRLFASGSGDTTIRTVEFTNFQIEKGSTVHDYSPYFEPFTFTPITPTPETALGVNNFWADEGDSEVTYRADLDLYEEPSTLSDTNNTETEGNEEQEVNE